MSIENERKYILSLTPKFRTAIQLAETYGGVVQIIDQAYIGEGRIRKIEIEKEPTEYFFTWKKARPRGDVIEIETEISKFDFTELWKMADTFLCKIRVKVQGYGVKWDTDFLFDARNPSKKGGHYLTLAEVEMPPTMDEPVLLPPFVKDNLVYLVPREEQEKWTNKNLADPEKVARMLKEEAGFEYDKTQR